MAQPVPLGGLSHPWGHLVARHVAPVKDTFLNVIAFLEDSTFAKCAPRPAVQSPWASCWSC